MILHINGWPGSGKYTVGRIVAERLGARFVPNHVIIGPGLAIDAFDSPAFKATVRAVRRIVFGQIVEAPAGTRFVLTNVLVEAEEDARLLRRTAELASARQVPFLAVILDCALEENVRRLDTQARAARHSLTDVAVLRELRARYSLLRPEAAHRLELDVTSIAPKAAADQIVAAVDPRAP